MSKLESGAALLLDNLQRLGVDKIFIVSGTDYAAIIEEKAAGIGPEFVIAPHEVTAVSAAMGYSLGGGIGVAAVHTLPGTANSLGVLMDAYGSKIPLLLIAGRTPYTDGEAFGSRSSSIHWTQETRDQGEILRQWTKLDFEIRRPEQIPSTIARAILLAMSEPTGPVYLSFPREVTVEKAKKLQISKARFEPGPAPESIKESARLINESKNPVIIASRAGRRRSWFDSFQHFVDSKNIPVLNYVGEVLNYPSSGRMSIDNFDLVKSDLAIVVECEVPWIPSKVDFKGTVIKVDTDPAHQYMPYYSFKADLTVLSCVDHFFNPLLEKVNKRDPEAILEQRREELKNKKREIGRWSRARNKIHPRYLSYEVGKLGMPVLNEYPLNPRYADFEEFGSYYGDLSAGYLGWTLGAAVGYRMATGKIPIAAVGDGAFFFGVPDSFYYLSYHQPVLVVIFDNGGWLASERSVMDVFPEGAAVMKKNFPGTAFEHFDMGSTVEAFGGYFELIEKPDEVKGALKRGKDAVEKIEKTAVLQFIVEKTR